MNRCRTTCKVSLHKEKGRPTKNMHGLPYPYRPSLFQSEMSYRQPATFNALLLMHLAQPNTCTD